MSTQKFKGSLMILAAAVAWFFVRTMSQWILARRFFPVPNFIFEMGDTFHEILGLLAGIGVFSVLVVHQKSKGFLDEVSIEVSKVTWPTMKETVNATIVVAVAVVIAGFALGGMDWLIGTVLKYGFYQRFMAG